MIDFVANRLEVVQPEIHDRITNVRDLIQLLQTFHHKVANDTGGNFRLAHFLQLRFDLSDHALDVGGGDGSLRARDANAARQLFTVKLFARAILLDQQRRGKNGTLVRAEALSAFEAFAAAADSSVVIMGGI